ncbi:MAG: site-specific integrase [Clostridia bacterium]|nr:site-specific integrase [Clostridia bacterium]
MTVAGLTDAWLRHLEAHRRPATVTFYRWGARHFLPRLGAIRLERLSTGHIQRGVDELLAAGEVTPAGARKVLVALHAALEFARHMRWLSVNPAEGIEVGRPAEHVADVLTEEQVERLLEAARGTQWEVPVWLAARCGLRVGEIVALERRDVDLRHRRVTVQRSMQRSGQVGPTKSGRSRIVELASEEATYLDSWRRRQAALRLQAGRWEHPELVVTGPEGRRIHVASPTHAVRKLALRAGLPPISMHDLRHTHGSILLARGWDLAAVSERLGHTSVAFTARVYVHVLPGRQRALIEAQERMGGKRAATDS